MIDLRKGRNRLMYSLNCVICREDFDHSQGNTKTCSLECRRERAAKITGRYSDRSISTPTVGAMSEMVVSVELMEKGYAVFRSLSPACVCDLVIISSKQKDWFPIRVEVRTGYRSETGNIYFPKSEKDKDRQDIFAIYVRNEKKVFYLLPDGKTPCKDI